MTTSILNADGTVNLEAALAQQATAEAAYAAHLVLINAADRDTARAPRFSMARGKAEDRFNSLRDGLDGLNAAIRLARGAVWEAMNPDDA